MSRQLKSTLAMAFALLIIAIVATHQIGMGEFNFNVDESQHACTGQFVAALIRDHPFLHPVEYTYLYYAHYPALSGVIHWPPCFYIFEGLAFSLFGASVVTARLAVLAFGLIGLAFWFRLIERLLSVEAALAATLLLGLTPVVVSFDKMVMLEIPSLALAIVASYFWICFLREQRNVYLYWFAFTAAMAALTKQNDVYLMLFCVLSLTALKSWRLLYRRAALIALAIAVLLAGPYYLVLYKVHWGTIAGDALEKQPTLTQSFAFYIKALPGLTGWPILVLAFIGVATCYLWAQRTSVLIFACWFVSVYLTMTLIGHKEARYVIYLVPALLYFALWPILWKALPRQIYGVAMGCLIAYLAWSAWGTERPWVAGYAPVANAIRKDADSGIVLVDSDLPANFIFFMRNQDPEERFVVLRKALYSFRIKESLGSQVYLHTPGDIEQVLRDDGIRFILVSNRLPDPVLPISGVLRDVLRTNQFRLLGQFPVEGSSPMWKGYSLLLYENLQAQPPVGSVLHIPMQTMSYDIDVPFDKLGVSFPSGKSGNPNP